MSKPNLINLNSSKKKTKLLKWTQQLKNVLTELEDYINEVDLSLGDQELVNKIQHVSLLLVIKKMVNLKFFLLSSKEVLKFNKLSKLIITNNPVVIDICEIIKQVGKDEETEKFKELKKNAKINTEEINQIAEKYGIGEDADNEDYDDEDYDDENDEEFLTEDDEEEINNFKKILREKVEKYADIQIEMLLNNHKNPI